MDEAWREWCDRLAAELATLGESEFLNTAGPVVTRDAGRGLLGRPRRPVVVSAPVFAVLGMGSHLLAESVTAFPTRGEPELGDEQREQLRAAGWSMPGHAGHEGAGGPQLQVYIPSSQPERVAELAVETYRILGVSDPADVTVDRGA